LQSVIRVAAWNVGHRTRKKLVPPEVVEAIATLTPDVVVLTEYVVGPSHNGTVATLVSSGLQHVDVTESMARENQVLVACRWAFQRGSLRPPDITSSTVPNLYHLRCSDPDLDLVALRIPMFTRAQDRTAYWDWLRSTLEPLAHGRRLVIGDMNTDPSRVRSIGGRHVARLAVSGWTPVTPASGVSFFSKRGATSRIDHALLGSQLRLRNAQYITSANGMLLAGHGASAYSDHAVLLLDVALA
jgi:endonuclease/exonuclease/phosphatase family metal-dependent hydrolase